ncbi:hypothetical protein GE061_006238 [Apolygus lucorum]|uniref:Peptidase S1 domain-containing protein n=1 Tax=Apolygus lucorum TaxID=248454 RepID=A0A8S9WSN7_APOLU|nr:hypothetical protein GE061_006238 [Apolygus lucorum]
MLMRRVQKILCNGILACVGLTIYFHTFVSSDCSGRITFGGCEVPVTDAPWTVGMVSAKQRAIERPFCSGTIIEANWVLTAAHCTRKFLENPSKIVMIAGADHKTDFKNLTLVQRRNALKIHQHPDYVDGDGSSAHDTSLVYVKEFIFTPRVMPMKLWDEKWPGEDVLMKCEAFGWGLVANRYDQGHVVYTNTLRKTVIRALHGFCPCLYRRSLQIQLICSHPSSEGGICSGDSGGPLICNKKLAGVAFAAVAGDCRVFVGGPKLPCNSPETMNLWMYVCPVLDFLKLSNVTSAPEKPENCRSNRPSSTLESFIFWVLMLCSLSESWI